MRNRFIVFAALLAIAAVAAGGGVASAKSKANHHTVLAHHVSKHAAAQVPADTDSVESGDQTSPDLAGAAGPETSGEEQASDGPGGHEDPPGAEEDHQAEGVE